MNNGPYQPSADEACFKETADFNASLLPKSAKGKLLDVGAYRGLLKSCIPSSIEYQGVDLQDWGFSYIAAVDLNESGLPFNDNQFDYIYATNIIEHLLIPPDRILKEIKRVCKPNATIIISLPNDRGLASLLIGSSGLMRLFTGLNSAEKQQFGHHWLYDHNVASSLLSKYFHIQKTLSHPGFLLKKIPIVNRIKIFTSDLYFICKNNQ